MREFGIDDYGLVLSEDLVKVMALKSNEEFTEEDWLKDKYAVIEGILYKPVEYISSFTGEAFTLTDDGRDDFGKVHSRYDMDSVYFIPLIRYPSLFKAAYTSMDDVKKELLDAVAEYLPEGYDIRRDICHIVGSYCG